MGSYLLLYIDDRRDGRKLMRRLGAAAAGACVAGLAGVREVLRQNCYALSTEREAFGFRDGISHPAVEGSGIPGQRPAGTPPP